MPMRIFENRNRSGAYLVMLVVGAAMFGMFYFITFFVQGVREYGPLQDRRRVPAGRVRRSASCRRSSPDCCRKFGPKPLIDHRHQSCSRSALLWFSPGRTRTRATAGKLLPGMIDAGGRDGLPVRPADRRPRCPRSPTPTPGWPRRCSTSASRSAARSGLSVMTTVFGTAARNYAGDHSGHSERRRSGTCPAAQQDDRRTARPGRPQTGLQPDDITNLGSLPGRNAAQRRVLRRARTATSRGTLLAHASGQGFLTGAGFGLVAIIAAVVLINVKKDDLPADARRPLSPPSTCSSARAVDPRSPLVAVSGRPIRRASPAASLSTR